MERKGKLPLQISKTFNATLFDEEVEAWQALEKYLLKKGRPIQSPRNVEKLSVIRVLREIVRLATENMARETGDQTLVDKLQSPRLVNPVGRPSRASGGASSSSVSKPRGRPPSSAKTTESDKPGRRIHWDREWRGPNP